jgi:hypothetical protein
MLAKFLALLAAWKKRASVVLVTKGLHCARNAKDVLGGPDLEKPREIMQCAVNQLPIYRVVLVEC